VVFSPGKSIGRGIVQHRKVSHREGFNYLWEGVKFIFKNWQTVGSVGTFLLLFGSTIFGTVILPIG